MGAHLITHNGWGGMCFSVWARNARSLSVVGSFMGGTPSRTNSLRGFFRHLGRIHPGWRKGAVQVPHRVAECRLPVDKRTPWVCCMRSLANGVGGMGSRLSVGRRRLDEETRHGQLAAPAHSIYEVHLGSWMRYREDQNRSLTYRETALDSPNMWCRWVHPRRFPGR